MFVFFFLILRRSLWFTPFPYPTLFLSFFHITFFFLVMLNFFLFFFFDGVPATIRIFFLLLVAYILSRVTIIMRVVAVLFYTLSLCFCCGFVCFFFEQKIPELIEKKNSSFEVSRYKNIKYKKTKKKSLKRSTKFWWIYNLSRYWAKSGRPSLRPLRFLVSCTML